MASRPLVVDGTSATAAKRGHEEAYHEQHQFAEQYRFIKQYHRFGHGPPLGFHRYIEQCRHSENRPYNDFQQTIEPHQHINHEAKTEQPFHNEHNPQFGVQPHPEHQKHLFPPPQSHQQEHTYHLPHTAHRDHVTPKQRSQHSHTWKLTNFDPIHGPVMRRSSVKTQQHWMQDRHPSPFDRGSHLQNNDTPDRLDQSIVKGQMSFGMPAHTEQQDFFAPSEQQPTPRSHHASPTAGEQLLWQPKPGTSRTIKGRDRDLCKHPRMSDQCLNFMPGKTDVDGRFRIYKACPCEFCQSKDRSIFVGTCNNQGFQNTSHIKAIHTACSRFGHVAAVQSKSQGKAAEITFEKQESTWEAISHLNMTAIPGLCGEMLKVSHPIGSQYFKPWVRPCERDAHHFEQRIQLGRAQGNGEDHSGGHADGSVAGSVI